MPNTPTPRRAAALVLALLLTAAAAPTAWPQDKAANAALEKQLTAARSKIAANPDREFGGMATLRELEAAFEDHRCDPELVALVNEFWRKVETLPIASPSLKEDTGALADAVAKCPPPGVSLQPATPPPGEPATAPEASAEPVPQDPPPAEPVAAGATAEAPAEPVPQDPPPAEPAAAGAPAEAPAEPGPQDQPPAEPDADAPPAAGGGGWAAVTFLLLLIVALLLGGGAWWRARSRRAAQDEYREPEAEPDPGTTNRKRANFQSSPAPSQPAAQFQDLCSNQSLGGAGLQGGVAAPNDFWPDQATAGHAQQSARSAAQYGNYAQVNASREPWSEAVAQLKADLQIEVGKRRKLKERVTTAENTLTTASGNATAALNRLNEFRQEIHARLDEIERNLRAEIKSSGDAMSARSARTETFLRSELETMAATHETLVQDWLAAIGGSMLTSADVPAIGQALQTLVKTVNEFCSSGLPAPCKAAWSQFAGTLLNLPQRKALWLAGLLSGELDKLRRLRDAALGNPAAPFDPSSDSVRALRDLCRWLRDRLQGGAPEDFDFAREWGAMEQDLLDALTPFYTDGDAARVPGDVREAITACLAGLDIMPIVPAPGTPLDTVLHEFVKFEPGPANYVDQAVLRVESPGFRRKSILSALRKARVVTKGS